GPRHACAPREEGVPQAPEGRRPLSLLRDDLANRRQAEGAAAVRPHVLRRLVAADDDGARQRRVVDRRRPGRAPNGNRPRTEGKEAVMNLAIAIFAKVTVTMAAALALTRLVRNGRASERHVLLAASFAILAAVPI